jgi:hypothetical protein
MLRICMLTAALCTVLAVPPAVADEAAIIPAKPQRPEVLAAASAMPVEAWACKADAVEQEPADDSVRWRWRAYRHIDCMIDMVERLQRQADGEAGTVMVSQDELQQLRTLAFQAKDAAARIAR